TDPTSGPALHVTYVGGPTALIEVGGFRLLTDPTFDPAGTRFRLTTKLAGPALEPGALGRIDAVLLSHDQHPDNLDAAGREVLSRAGVVLTTPAGAARLGGNAVGLAPWESYALRRKDGRDLGVTAVPARHGPAGIEPRIGDVTGFVASLEGAGARAVYVSGDTVFFDGVAEIGRRFEIGAAFLHLGAVRFPDYGPERVTMDAEEAASAFASLGARTFVPLHFEGWTHLRETHDQLRAVFERTGIADRVVWLEPGRATSLRHA
ncbi:MAG TPA: MBL fold metallo-hydrolase, partial [Anaeromyxobacteraceae bacterium]|nr:MBL fold metallo-hydrolase [Anaeromyxobacteraceae bacterium]